jgi:hypothetical protein
VLRNGHFMYILFFFIKFGSIILFSRFTDTYNATQACNSTLTLLIPQVLTRTARKSICTLKHHNNSPHLQPCCTTRMVCKPSLAMPTT